MRYGWYILLCLLLPLNKVEAQLADGAIAPDFTFTDINGNTQHLYDYLDQGKHVVLDISATWCVPCWNYHNTGTLDSIYQLHDLPGAGDWKVIFIEADATTDSADLHGTGTNTQGDWVQGAAYTIIDPPQGAALSNFKNAYAVSYFPTFYMICPDRRAYQDTFLKILTPHVSTWEYGANDLCAATGIEDVNSTVVADVFPNPAHDELHITFPSKYSGTTVLRVVNMMGQVMDFRSYELTGVSGHTILYDTRAMPRGFYYFLLSCGSYSAAQKVLLR